MLRLRQSVILLITGLVIIANWKIAAADTISSPGTTISDGQQGSQSATGVTDNRTPGYEALPIKHWIIVGICSLILLIGVPLWVRYRDGKENYWRVVLGMLVSTLFLLLASATLFTLIHFLFFVGSPYTRYTPLFGLETAVPLGVLAAVSFRSYATSKRAVPSSYDELQQRATHIDAYESLIADSVTSEDFAIRSAATEVREQSSRVKAELAQPGLRWVLATGYIAVWKRLHRAEEALIEFEPEQAVIAGALNDKLRLLGSNIENSDELLEHIRRATAVIDPMAPYYLASAKTPLPLIIVTPDQLPAATIDTEQRWPLDAVGGTVPYSWSIVSGGGLPGISIADNKLKLNATPMEGVYRVTANVTDSSTPPQSNSKTFVIQVRAARALAATCMGCTARTSDPKKLARAVLRASRRALGEFRDERWNAIVVARNRLAATTVFAAITAYILLALAIFRDASDVQITAAAVFFLVGAIAGLIDRLRDEAQVDSAVEDYGLAAMRLKSTALISGIAGVAGVVMVAMLSLSASAFTTHSAPANRAGTANSANVAAQTPTAEPQRVTLPALAEVFDLERNPGAVLIAAIFGLTPSLLFSRLRQQGENLKADLKSVELAPAAARA